MANPTQQVSSGRTPYDQTEFYWPLIGGDTVPTTYQTGEMIGLRSDGYAGHFDDSASMKFLGIVMDIPVVMTSADAAGARLIRLSRPYRLEIPVASAGTVSRVSNIGANMYAAFSGTCTLSSGSFANTIGNLVDVLGTSAPNALTGTVAVIEPCAGVNFGGNTGTAGAIVVTSITGDTDPLNLRGLAGVTSTAGGLISSVGGAGDTSGAGGAIVSTGGVGGSASGSGGAVTLAGGAGAAGNAVGGVASLTGGASNGSGIGAISKIVGGVGGATGAGGAAQVTGGAGGATSGIGGAATVTAGAGINGNSAGGVASATGGAGQGSAAGGVGKVVGGVGGATGAGGAAQVTGGAGGASSGTGGAVTVVAGAGSGGNATGGAVTISGGAKNGSGANGSVTIQSAYAPVAGGGTSAAILCTSTALLGLYFGTGDPTFSAAKGSIYSKTDAATSATRIFVATDAVGTWAAFTAAS